MKILLLGCHGQLGSALSRTLPQAGELVPLGSDNCDLRNTDALLRQLDRIRPQVIVNAAAYTAVDQAETDVVNAYLINTAAPLLLAKWAQRHDALLVHYSSDYVFDGKKKSAYLESDDPQPLNVYGKTKWEADVAIQATCERHLILRTSWLVGAHGANFITTVLALARQQAQLQVVNDQWGAPTCTSDLASLTASMVRQVDNRAGAPYGLYHATAAGVTNWYALACYVVERAQSAGYPMKAGVSSIMACTSDQCSRPAKRPTNSALDSGKLAQFWGLQITDWQQGVDQVLAHIV